jgi:hypothetical protein
MTTTEDGKTAHGIDFTKLLGSVTSLSDGHLDELLATCMATKAAREQQRKDEAIAKIRALAGDAGIVVSIAGSRGKRAPARRSARREKRSA